MGGAGISLDKVKAVILAGGQGARFWPLSRMRRPKQFLVMGAGGQSLIQATAERAEKFVGREGVYVVTNENLKELVHQHVPFGKIICEPFGRNTAASIGLAAVFARQQCPGAITLILPADHAVADCQKLLETWAEAVDVAASQRLLVTIGIVPTRPDTAYGYIRRGERLRGNCFSVQRFFEKPNLERATRYCEAGDYFWNSGMFVWQADVILEAIGQYMPVLAEGLARIERSVGKAEEKQVMKEVFAELDSVSIDFGVLELARNCAMVEAQPFGWNDVGSWDAWAEHFKVDQRENLVHGDVLVIESGNCVVHANDTPGHKRLIALLGAEGLVVIDSGDAVLICPRDRAQDVKRIVDILKQQGRNELV